MCVVNTVFFEYAESPWVVVNIKWPDPYVSVQMPESCAVAPVGPLRAGSRARAARRRVGGAHD